MYHRQIRVYPDTPERIAALAEQTGFKAQKPLEVENAWLMVFMK